MQATHSAYELVSALIDGELPDEEVAAVMTLLETNTQAQAYWHACHVARDALCDTDLVTTAASDAAFLARLRGRLAQEVTALQPLATPSVSWQSMPEAANDAGRWHQVAVVAALGLAAVLGWQLGLPQGEAVLASVDTAPVPVTAAPSQTMLRDPELDALLAAHRQQGGASAWLQPAGFLRSATLEPVSASVSR